MLLMCVYGELSSKKDKQKNVHLLPPKVCAVLKRKPVSLFLSFCQFKKKGGGEKKKEKHTIPEPPDCKGFLNDLSCLRRSYFKEKQKPKTSLSPGIRAPTAYPKFQSSTLQTLTQFAMTSASQPIQFSNFHL